MLGLEPGWHDHAYPTARSSGTRRGFPTRRASSPSCDAQHVRANLWFNPYVSPTAPLYAKLLPFAGSHLVWNGIVPDYSMPAARTIFADHLRRKVVELARARSAASRSTRSTATTAGSGPTSPSFPSGHDGEQLRQTYGAAPAAAAHGPLPRPESPHARSGARHQRRRVVVPVRHLQRQLRLRRIHHRRRATAPFAGVLWSPEVRGGDGEDMLRRIQAVCFSPLALFNGWATDTKLWTHAEVADDIREAIVLRMRLLPVLVHRRSRSTTSRARRWCGRCRSSRGFEAALRAAEAQGPVHGRRRAARRADRARRAKTPQGRAARGEAGSTSTPAGSPARARRRSR